MSRRRYLAAVDAAVVARIATNAEMQAHGPDRPRSETDHAAHHPSRSSTAVAVDRPTSDANGVRTSVVRAMSSQNSGIHVKVKLEYLFAYSLNPVQKYGISDIRRK
jgi:hypothetical protein